MGSDIPVNYMRYWGKAKKTDLSEGDDYHLLAYHCLDVAACGYQLVIDNRFHASDILAKLGFSRAEGAYWFAFFLVMHDIGKFARGFQRLYPHNNPALVPDAGRIYPLRHDSLGYWLLNNYILPRWLEEDISLLPGNENKRQWTKSVDIWLQVVTGHHGEPPDTASGALAFTREDMLAAEAYLLAIQKIFPETCFPPQFADKAWRHNLKKQSWLLAGLAVLADWLGSNQQYFPFVASPIPLATYWEQAQRQAQGAIASLPPISAVNTRHEYQSIFPFIKTLTPLQRYADDVDIGADGGQLFILEDVTGAGKTEAALILVNRLMAQGKADGLYVGLPTMATANAMYQRLADAYHALFQPSSRPSLVLAHGASKMSKAFSQSVWQGDNAGQPRYDMSESSASSECNSWFADSRKKALLAEVGVGTLDQLLMAAMPYRHQSLRLLGINHKVLILDEVHAYDSYMVRLLEGLLYFHAAQGGSAIILSATLPYSLRCKLLTAFARGAEWPVPMPVQDAGYPWVSHLHGQSLIEKQLATRAEVQRSVSVGWLTHLEDALTMIEQAVAEQRCICWIRNSVDDAMLVYRQLQQRGKVSSEDLLLFHSRFAFVDRLRVEQKTLDWFGKHADPQARRGKVLIATQVIEQSLDIDLDMMISDLAPIDLLIQRAGRLQRHIRDENGNTGDMAQDARSSPVLSIFAPEWQPNAQPDWLGEALRNTGYVYPDHACLWRTQAILRELKGITMPEQARTLVESVYEGRIEAPPALSAVEDKVYGARLGERMAAGQNVLSRDKGYDRRASSTLWSPAAELTTRLGEETLDIYLAYRTEEGIEPYAGGDEFPWEKSRVQVRENWWRKNCSDLPQLSAQELEEFRQRQHRPGGVVLLLEPGCDYYHQSLGLLGNAS
ncbi:CRISPR-associated helicase Cas3' [Serratia inhibens]|uniref:CRISPR-associated helicase Cas3 n=1 Tax=Serratia inhibens TaxID=2338073 RepID=A0AA93BYR1_9GAMM|nr:CRISPR-associated helicase Cas3' [Serratia inhibens]RJF55393.1 CRISPR-associated helicase Cas3' [Serratia inhibens]